MKRTNLTLRSYNSRHSKLGMVVEVFKAYAFKNLRISHSSLKLLSDDFFDLSQWGCMIRGKRYVLTNFIWLTYGQEGADSSFF